MECSIEAEKGMWEWVRDKEKMGSLDLFTPAPGNETPLRLRLTMRVNTRDKQGYYSMYVREGRK